MLRLRLRWRALSQLLSAPSASPISQLLGYHSRLLSAAAPAVSTNHSFAVEDYLVSTCGLPQAQALKASHKLAHLKSPANPDAVLAFLAGLGLSGADVAALVARDPRFLCAGVGTILAPNVAALTGLGLACSDIAHLLWHAPTSSIVPNIHYCLVHLRVLRESPLCYQAQILHSLVRPRQGGQAHCRAPTRVWDWSL
ncbi:hypothetical protein CFC21_085955 [Triticum aestivum]|uniref:Uncharacterized protein n=2 Tax=Triticum aestivum TaxID=4565 RepID=A0A3B6PDC5_WHEAT|nr:hypothetical protein CFC21_085955 [Triticum aestivum]